MVTAYRYSPSSQPWDAEGLGSTFPLGRRQKDAHPALRVLQGPARSAVAQALAGSQRGRGSLSFLQGSLFLTQGAWSTDVSRQKPEVVVT